MTDATITTRVALAVIDVNLAAVTSETDSAHASKGVDQIIAYAAIQTWIQLTLVNVNLTLCACEPCNKSVRQYMLLPSVKKTTVSLK